MGRTAPSSPSATGRWAWMPIAPWAICPRRCATISPGSSWSHGDDEIMSSDDMIAWFDVDGIGKSAARFDFAKLESLNAHYIRAAEDDQLIALLLEALPHLPERARIRGAADAGKERAAPRRAAPPQGAGEDAQCAPRRRPVPVCQAAARDGGGGKGPSSIRRPRPGTLAELKPVLEAVPDWRAEPLEAAVKAFAVEKGVEARQGGATAPRCAHRAEPPRLASLTC